VQPSFSPRLELEVLYGVRHVDALAVYARLRSALSKSCPAVRRTGGLHGLPIPWLLADQHNLCVLPTLPEYGLGRVQGDRISEQG
jgi:hypothetical protein